MVILLKPKIWGPEYSCSDVMYLQNPQLKVPYVTAGDVIAPPSPPLSWGWGVETAGEQNTTKIFCKNAVCSFVICHPHRHLSTF
jgi:hypothetical protein